MASWSGVPNSRRPRPLHVNTSAPRGAPGQHGVQVLVGARRVAHLELHRRPDRYGVAHRDRAGCPIGPEHAPDEEVAALELLLRFVDHDAAVQTLLGELAVGGRHRPSVVSSRSRRLAAELVDHVAVGASDDVGATDRPATLRHDGLRGDVLGEQHADGPVAVRGAVDEQPVLAGALAADAMPPTTASPAGGASCCNRASTGNVNGSATSSIDRVPARSSGTPRSATLVPGLGFETDGERR